MELIKIETNENGEQVVSGRELHEFLEIKTKYNDWFLRMCEYGFAENIDFITITQKKVTAQGNNTSYIDHKLTIAMSKELAMLARNEQGKKARQYFIKVETAWNTPEMIMARALQLANHKIEQFSNEVKKLKTEVIHKEGVIIGLVSDISLAEKRQRITQIVRYGANNNYQERYRLLYSEVQKKFHLDLNRRIESKEVLEIKPKIKNKMDLLERGIFINGSVRNLIPETYEIACKLFENDLKELLKEWDSTIQRV